MNNQTTHFDNMAQLQQLTLDERPVDMPSQPKSANSTPQAMIATESSLFEEDLDQNPHSHFLSPVHTYESWDDSDNESDDGSYPLDAGIMDFSLFTDDYNRAKEQNLPLPDKWSSFVTDQAEAYDRAVARSRAEVTDRPAGPFHSSNFSQPRDAVPALTPDTSPRLADDLDFEEPSSTSTPPNEPTHHATSNPINIPSPNAKASASATLTSISESAIDDTDYDDPATPAFLLYQHSQRTDRRRRLSQPQQQQPPLLRPGLSAGRRTLSGKLHVWKRPSWELYSVFEDEEEVESAGQGVTNGRKGAEGLRRVKGREVLRG